LFVQKKELAPSPTNLLILSSNKLPIPIPISSRNLKMFSHHVEAPLLPSQIRPPSSPYVAVNTLYHKPSHSTCNLQHHFPDKAKLNSNILLTPKPSLSFPKQAEFQLTKAIFLVSSSPPKNEF